MTCPICVDRGIVRVRYRDGSPDDFGVCRCVMGLRYREERDGCAVWMLWAAREQVPHEQVFLVEELLEDDELARIPVPAQRRVVSIADAMDRDKL
jgi:hypothetical protein